MPRAERVWKLGLALVCVIQVIQKDHRVPMGPHETKDNSIRYKFMIRPSCALIADISISLKDDYIKVTLHCFPGNLQFPRFSCVMYHFDININCLNDHCTILCSIIQYINQITLKNKIQNKYAIFQKINKIQ